MDSMDIDGWSQRIDTEFKNAAKFNQNDPNLEHKRSIRHFLAIFENDVHEMTLKLLFKIRDDQFKKVSLRDSIQRLINQ